MKRAMKARSDIGNPRRKRAAATVTVHAAFDQLVELGRCLRADQAASALGASHIGIPLRPATVSVAHLAGAEGIGQLVLHNLNARGRANAATGP